MLYRHLYILKPIYLRDATKWQVDDTQLYILVQTELVIWAVSAMLKAKLLVSLDLSISVLVSIF